MEKPHTLRYFVPAFFLLAAACGAVSVFKESFQVINVSMTLSFLLAGIFYAVDMYQRVKR